MSAWSKIKEAINPFRVIRYFSIACFLLPPILGSAAGTVFIGGGLWSIGAVVIRRRWLNLERAMRMPWAAVYAYCASQFLASAVNLSFSRDRVDLLSLTPFLLFPFSYSTWSIIDKASLRRIVSVCMMLGCFCALPVALVQVTLFRMRAESGDGNAIVFAMVMTVFTLTCFYNALQASGSQRWWFVLAVLAGSMALLYSGSRSLWAGALVGAVAVILACRFKLNKEAIRALLLLAGIVVVSAFTGLGMISNRATDLVRNWNEIEESGEYGNSLGYRIALFHVGWDVFREKPLFGHGAGAREPLIANGMRDKFGLRVRFTHFHNGFLTVLVEAGLVGALALAALFVVAAYRSVRVLRDSADPTERFGASLLLTTVITYLVAGLTGILVGHDIVDCLLMIVLVTGIYLSSGTQIPLPARVRASMGEDVAGPDRRP